MRNGFTLLEVLIALVLIGIGLLGVAVLQIRSVQITQSAYWQNVAEIAADRLVEQLYVYPNTQHVALINVWQKTITQILPAGRAVITKLSQRYQIQLSWADSNAINHSTQCAEAIAQQRTCWMLDLSL